MKIIIAGPPHSGKSVFLSGLVANCPDSYLFRACPDGEGTWTYKSPSAVQYRRKGTFTTEIMQWYVSALHRPELSPLTLVDVGGRITPENERIFSACDGCIILSSDPAKFAEWEEFCSKTGVAVVARIWSDYNGTEDNTENPMMSVHHLERGEDVSCRPTIEKVAAMLHEMVAKNNNKTACPVGKNGVNKNMTTRIEISNLAETLGKTATTKTLPNGKVISSVQWDGSDLVEVARLLHNEEKSEIVEVNGGAPAWLVAAIAHECHPSIIAVNSPDGYVTASCGDPAATPTGNNLSWEVIELGEGVVRVNVQQTDPSIPLSPADLAGWCPPVVPFGTKTVVLSGRMPNWGMTALAMSYHGKCGSCALFQPGVGATVVWTHTQDIRLGELLPME